MSGAGANGEREQKTLGGSVRGFLNSLEGNWSSTAQLCSSAAHIMSRPAQVGVAWLDECANTNVGFIRLYEDTGLE